MMKRLNRQQSLYVGSLLFGLFFGAGNLIFPVFLGQHSGQNVWPAILGFLLTGVGLPLLGVVALGLTRSRGSFELANRISRPYAYLFTILLYLTIGPFFALPRLATTSFQIGIVPFTGQHQWLLVIFSLGFFLLAWWFARKPSKLIEIIGKYLNPIFLILLGSLLLIALIKPLGSISQVPALAGYQNHAFFTGFTAGYNTMDALAALAFGVVVTDTIIGLGVTRPTAIARDTVRAGLISMSLMAIIYALLAIMGTMSAGHFKPSANGGIALAQIANYYFGGLGSTLLALIVIIACLKTAIGLISAFGESFHRLFPKVSYLVWISLASSLACLFANVGLTKIIAYSTPVLYFIYPLAVTLMLLGILSPLFHHRQIVYLTTTSFTFLVAIIDGLNVAPASLRQLTVSQTCLNLAQHYLPLFSIGLDWLLPAIIGFLVGLLLSHFWPKQIKLPA
ncbi:branched-chain amino acid transport system II carrier protein [Loigolactobacillus backii]|uniref:branched-chain amino acid transport system II carrier protein n=1 Tax=Loigolactobacillus backii TaxID=375175 RepID=UPI000C1C950B|nr:branched-chain amino acid transport system II carrier protein [Loigolactobacillus backii]PIO83516.1 branched-chain amino acid transport system II carrier protein [Loigolactobacillus backii]